MNTDDTDFQIKNGPMNFFDPCKSVLSVSSVVRFGLFAIGLSRFTRDKTPYFSPLVSTCLYPSGTLNKLASTALVEIDVTSVLVSIREPGAPAGFAFELSS